MKTSADVLEFLANHDDEDDPTELCDVVRSLESQLEATHRRFQAEAREVERLKNELVQRTNDFTSMRRLKRLVDGYKNKFYEDYKAAARERDLATLYIQLLEGKRDRY